MQSILIAEIKEKGVRKMHRDKLLKIGTSTLLILLLTVGFFAFATPQPLAEDPWDFPRLDEIWMIEAYPRATAMEKARACDIDNYIGMITKADIIELRDVYGWSVTSTPGFHMCYVGINCREVTPDTSGGTIDNGGRLPGDPLYPMTISQLRMALELIVGCEKDAWIADIYGFVNVRLDNTIPPANAFWYNPYIQPYAEDWPKAVSVLLGGGFYYDDGADNVLHTTDDIWYMPNSVKLIGGPTSTSPGSDRVGGYDAGHLPDKWGIQAILVGKAVAPTSYEVMGRHVEKWNQFFTGVVIDTDALVTPTGFDTGHCLDGALFHVRNGDPSSIITDIAFCNRDHDVYMLCWGLDRNPDYLYDFFHPDMDVYDGSNSPGLDHAGLNRLLKSLKMWAIEDYEILEVNFGDYPSGLVIPPCTTYGPFGPFNNSIPHPEKTVVIERCSQEDGVYDEVLEEGIQENEMWENRTDGWYVTIHIKTEIVLWPGDALEVLFAPGTYYRVIYSLDEMREVVWLIQWKLYYLVPYLPIYSRNYFDLFKPGWTCWVPSLGFGAGAYQTTMPWTFGSIHPVGTPVGGSIKWMVGGDVVTLNPFKVKWVYEVTVLNRMYDSLYVVNPYTHQDMPWVATHWEIIPWTAPDGDPGMILKVWLRNDVYWQDGIKVTADDIKWNFDFINSTQAPEYAPILSPFYQGCTVIHDNLIEIFVDGTGQWKAYEFLGAALTFPKIVWEPYWADYAGATAFQPWAVDYQTHTGRVPTGGRNPMTCLFGTGPFFLDYWDGVATAHLVKNINYWVRKVAAPHGQLGALRIKAQTYYDTKRGFKDPSILQDQCSDVFQAELEVLFTNMYKVDPCTFDWKVEFEGRWLTTPTNPGPVVVASGSVTALDPFGIYSVQPVITFREEFKRLDARTVQKFKLYVNKGAGWVLAYTIEWIVSPFPAGDLNGDGKVDSTDRIYMAALYRKYWLEGNYIP